MSTATLAILPSSVAQHLCWRICGRICGVSVGAVVSTFVCVSALPTKTRQIGQSKQFCRRRCSLAHLSSDCSPVHVSDRSAAGQFLPKNLTGQRRSADILALHAFQLAQAYAAAAAGLAPRRGCRCDRRFFGLNYYLLLPVRNAYPPRQRRYGPSAAADVHRGRQRSPRRLRCRFLLGRQLLHLWCPDMPLPCYDTPAKPYP